MVIGRKTAIIANPAAAVDERAGAGTRTEIARKTVLALGGYGLFGVELFVCGDEMIFQRSLPSSARYRDGYADFTGSL